jgi:hypothetical protein
MANLLWLEISVPNQCNNMDYLKAFVSSGQVIDLGEQAWMAGLETNNSGGSYDSDTVPQHILSEDSGIDDYLTLMDWNNKLSRRVHMLPHSQCVRHNREVRKERPHAKVEKESPRGEKESSNVSTVRPTQLGTESTP